MSTITTKDGTQIYYKDCGSGQLVIFRYGWPLSADALDSQMTQIVHGDDDQIVPSARRLIPRQSSSGTPR